MFTLKIDNGKLRVEPLKIENAADLDLVSREDATVMVWDLATSKYIHTIMGGSGSTGSSYIRLKQYIFTEQDVTSAATNGYLDVAIVAFDNTSLAVKDTHIDNGLQVIVGHFLLYPGTVATGGDYELIQGAADPGFADTIRIHKDWVVDAGEGIWGYIL